MDIAAYESRFPGVHFRGPISTALKIDDSVIIMPGAVISLAGRMFITGRTTIGHSAYIAGYDIRILDSTIDGLIQGPVFIADSTVHYGATILAGLLKNACIRSNSVVGKDSIIKNSILICSSISYSKVTNCCIGQTGIHNQNMQNALVGGSKSYELPQDIAEMEAFIKEQCHGGYLLLNATASTRLLQKLVKIDDALYYSEPPPEFIDTITQTLIKNAVFTPGGHTYDRDALMEWLRRSQTDPMTRELLLPANIVPNRSMQDQINEWKRKNLCPLDEKIAARSKS